MLKGGKEHSQIINDPSPSLPAGGGWWWWCGRDVDDMSLSICHLAPNWGNRTPGSLTPGVRATPSPRQRRTLRHRGLKNGHSRPSGRSAKTAAKCAKIPLQTVKTLSMNRNCELQLRNLHEILYRLNHGTCRCTTTSASTTNPRTVPVRSSQSAAQYAL